LLDRSGCSNSTQHMAGFLSPATARLGLHHLRGRFKIRAAARSRLRHKPKCGEEFSSHRLPEGGGAPKKAFHTGLIVRSLSAERRSSLTPTRSIRNYAQPRNASYFSGSSSFSSGRCLNPGSSLSSSPPFRCCPEHARRTGCIVLSLHIEIGDRYARSN